METLIEEIKTDAFIGNIVPIEGAQYTSDVYCTTGEYYGKLFIYEVINNDLCNFITYLYETHSPYLPACLRHTMYSTKEIAYVYETLITNLPDFKKKYPKVKIFTELLLSAVRDAEIQELLYKMPVSQVVRMFNVLAAKNNMRVGEAHVPKKGSALHMRYIKWHEQGRIICRMEDNQRLVTNLEPY